MSKEKLSAGFGKADCGTLARDEATAIVVGVKLNKDFEADVPEGGILDSKLVCAGGLVPSTKIPASPLTTSTKEASLLFSVTDLHRRVYGASRLSEHGDQSRGKILGEKYELTVKWRAEVDHRARRSEFILVNMDFGLCHDTDSFVHWSF